ncbi:hypothetical protein LCX93_07780 [Sulfurimonas sp. SWIR-19]|uniref:hypothetical protein n=1 Tax=Sulfurimonas sp. SWIR-19 TaxID=2878390 RepID=UPI001CF46F2F|nr:hypothetical protein [Sulfurimonas sp. SWIR-19]UCM99435.1 hypothetical protein LCX93_07780 [Sulfurimonas sp. SWIR-19]
MIEITKHKDQESFLKIFDATSYIIDSSAKIGKMTFVTYLVNSFFKEKALLFTSQESFLFQRRMNSLEKQFIQFEDIQKIFTPYYLKEDWHTLKQRYGFSFFHKELEHLIATSEEKIIIIHRFEEYFEFQDRYEIDNIYKALIKLVSEYDKKIFFLTNNKHENYEYVQHVADEFSDVVISISANEKNERIINIKDILHNKEHPYMIFGIKNETFLLHYYKESHEEATERTKTILIAQLDQTDDSLSKVCEYIFNREKFIIKHADSLQTMLQEIFIRPDLVIVMMKRTRANLETVTSIKTQLKDSPIIAILDQDFVRAEDIQEAYHCGCDELFSNNFSLDILILALQKAAKVPFYSNELLTLTKYKNIMESLAELKTLALECLDKSIFFTLFLFKTAPKREKIDKISRKHDYIYQTDDKLYYLALSTMPKDVKHIEKKYENLELESIWEPTKQTKIEECFK